jgi:ribose 5-phosphate isomerase B
MKRVITVQDVPSGGELHVPVGTIITPSAREVAATRGVAILLRDVGVHEEKAADYPDLALKVAELVAAGTAARGVAIDGAGIGSSIAANKVPGVRAALCYDKASARNSREHNDSNVLTLGARLLTESQAEDVLRTWIATPFAGGRHQARVQKILDIEQRYLKKVSS